jgi:hypothetical protein
MWTDAQGIVAPFEGAGAASKEPFLELTGDMRPHCARCTYGQDLVVDPLRRRSRAVTQRLLEAVAQYAGRGRAGARYAGRGRDDSLTLDDQLAELWPVGARPLYLAEVFRAGDGLQ